MRSILSLFKKKKESEDIRYVNIDQTDSTNRYCWEELPAILDPGVVSPKITVVTANYQSMGKGQGTNTWESASGKNLLFSILCHPVWVPIMGQFVISECIALAIRDVLSNLVGDITIKWPNDIYWKDKKICGILIENRLSSGHIKDCVIGVGLNVNQTKFHSDAPNPISLGQILGREIDRSLLLRDIVKCFSRYLQMLENGDYTTVPTAYASYLFRSEGFHPYKDGHGEFDAAIVEVEDDGHLILRDQEGHIRSYAFKEVEFIIHTPSDAI